MQFLGHILREDGLQKDILPGKVKGRKGRGRQILTYVGSINKLCTVEVTANEVIRRPLKIHDY